MRKPKTSAPPDTEIRRSPKSWKRVLPQLAEKLMDAGNLAFAGLLLGQLIGQTPLDLRTAGLGVGLWLALMGAGALMLYFNAGEGK